MAIRYIGFDCGNVLIRFDTDRFYSFIREHRQNCLEPNQLFSGSKQQIVLDYDLGRLSDHQFFTLIKDAFRLDSNATFDEFCYILGIIITPDYEMLGIRDLFRRRGVGTFLISNMNPLHYNYLKGFYPEVVSGYDDVFISSEEGIDKPKLEAFKKPLMRLRIRGEECIFIDDIAKNIEVISELGMKGWHLNVTDNNFISKNNLSEERIKLRNFLELIWERGILKPR